MDGLFLKTNLKQELKLSPQLLQSMKILQMDSQELLEYVDTLSEENPAFEKGDSPALQKEFDELRQKVSWLDSTAGAHWSPRSHSEEDEEHPAADPGAWDMAMESLESFLCDQLERRKLDKPLLALCKYLTALLNADGYLEAEELEGFGQLGVSQTLLEAGIETLQSLDPAGVAAQSLGECLLLQLRRRAGESSLAQSIVREYLTELGEKKYKTIAKALGVSEKDVLAAEKIIRELEPRPGAAFDSGSVPEYIRPDVFVVELDGSLQVVLNTYYLPRVFVSDYYVRLMQETGEEDTKQYLQKKVRQAKWVMECLDRRRSTLEGCTRAILEVQRAFFSGESRKLSSMTLRTVAEKLEAHESTVSRAIQGKYLQCRQGTFPLRYFFSRSVGGEEGPSEQGIKLELAKLLREESPRKPLSDQKLCELLAQQGIEIARRTVAKYRTELKIPTASARRRNG